MIESSNKIDRRLSSRPANSIFVFFNRLHTRIDRYLGFQPEKFSSSTIHLPWVGARRVRGNTDQGAGSLSGQKIFHSTVEYYSFLEYHNFMWIISRNGLSTVVSYFQPNHSKIQFTVRKKKISIRNKQRVDTLGRARASISTVLLFLKTATPKIQSILDSLEGENTV